MIIREVFGRVRRFEVLFVMAILIVWTGNVQASSSPVDDLNARANELWSARVKGDAVVQFNFIPPDERQVVSLEKFKAQSSKRGVKYLNFKLEKTEVDGQNGWIFVSYEVMLDKIPGSPVKKLEAWEIWHKFDDGWYPVSKKAGLAPAAPPSERDLAEEKRLSDRVSEFWSALRDQEWAKTYDLLIPQYRQEVSREEYLSKKALNEYISHRVDWVQVTKVRPLLGLVRVVYEFKVDDPTFTKQPIQEGSVMEVWVKIDGQWYRDVKKETDEMEEK